MSTNSIPVGSAVLGRVLNANGEPIDHKGSLDDAMHLLLSVPGALSAWAGTTSTRALETGIKVLDLMAPASSGSIIGMIAGSGLGLAVVTEEIMHTLVTGHQAVLVVAGMSETTYDQGVTVFGSLCAARVQREERMVKQNRCSKDEMGCCLSLVGILYLVGVSPHVCTLIPIPGRKDDQELQIRSPFIHSLHMKDFA